jgi:hypothetical protein
MRSSLVIALAASCSLFAVRVSAASAAADPSRQAEVSVRGAEVMPFALKATTHIFTKTDDGGVQQVVAKNPQDTEQIRLIREHLQQIAHQFKAGNFSAPAQIHGEAMPGLSELRHAKPGEIAIHYQDLNNGGQVRYSTSNASLVAALHRWFDAQLSDHGADAMAGHEHGGMGHD